VLRHRDAVANEAVTLDDFMARFCQERSKQNRSCRKKALLPAARHGTVKLPELAVPHKHGRAKKYFVHDLLVAWQGFLDEGVDLPPLVTEHQIDVGAPQACGRRAMILRMKLHQARQNALAQAITPSA